MFEEEPDQGTFKKRVNSKRDITETKVVTDPFCPLYHGWCWAAVQQSSVQLQLTSHHLLGKCFLPYASTARTVPAPWIYCLSPCPCRSCKCLLCRSAARGGVPLGAQPDPCGSKPCGHSLGEGTAPSRAAGVRVVKGTDTSQPRQWHFLSQGSSETM